MSIDEVYYADAGQISLARRVAASARTKVFQQFMRRMRPNRDSRILDVGSSDVETPEANMLEQLYPWPEQITAVGLGEGQDFRERYPSHYVQMRAGEPLPFPDGAFDIAWSNAVLEHVGGPGERKAFTSELLRVARRAFVIVPNRWFPIEHHTAIPLLHWHPPLFRRVVAGTAMKYWADPRNLEFLSRYLLSCELPQGKMRYAGLRLGPFSSNLVLIF
jgi:SAM-dependent methyltransferase